MITVKKLLEYGAVPITLSDASGHVYEPNGITDGKLTTINKIKQERGALLGRYIISSTTAEFNTPENILWGNVDSLQSTYGLKGEFFMILRIFSRLTACKLAIS